MHQAEDHLLLRAMLRAPGGVSPPWCMSDASGRAGRCLVPAFGGAD
jgi:hypothetical protein